MFNQLHPLLAQRRSPRGFDPTQPVSETSLHALLEAARWAPSSRNRQPWRFLLGRRGDETFKAIFDTLMPGNQVWAGDAAALVVAFAETSDSAGNPSHGTEYDLGLAVGQLVFQAAAEGLHVHQMGGFSGADLLTAFVVPSGFTPVTVIAVGHREPTEEVGRTRERRPLEEIAYAGRWGDPAV